MSILNIVHVLGSNGDSFPGVPALGTMYELTYERYQENEYVPVPVDLLLPASTYVLVDQVGTMYRRVRYDTYARYQENEYVPLDLLLPAHTYSRETVHTYSGRSPTVSPFRRHFLV